MRPFAAGVRRRWATGVGFGRGCFFQLGRSPESGRAVENLAEEDGIGSDDPGVVEGVGVATAYSKTQIQPAAAGDQLPEVLGLDTEQAAGQLVGLGVAALNQVGTEL